MGTKHTPGLWGKDCNSPSPPFWSIWSHKRKMVRFSYGSRHPGIFLRIGWLRDWDCNSPDRPMSHFGTGTCGTKHSWNLGCYIRQYRVLRKLLVRNHLQKITWKYTVWKFQNFTVTQILREINFKIPGCKIQDVRPHEYLDKVQNWRNVTWWWWWKWQTSRSTRS